ncbi:class I SAM-dependent methyltransferase [Streptomyces sp. NPDC006510]|uniref:class I SAM-dependent methyltransferase n=1 Tax=Streptomyces sp. NPDC006510 TaxID=3155600 RepID=UPI0033AA50FC
MAAYLASLGYSVDGVDFAEGALERARSEHAGMEGVRWLCLDVEHDDLADLAEDGYDLITLRLSIAFVRDRARVLRRLAALLREDGVLLVITPVAENTSSERRHIALDEDELPALTDGFENVERFDAEGLAVLVLRGVGGSFSAQESCGPTRKRSSVPRPWSPTHSGGSCWAARPGGCGNCPAAGSKQQKLHRRLPCGS